MGKWTGKLSTLIFALYFALLTHVIFIREVLFIRSWILPQAELYLLIALLGIPSYLVVKNHIGIVGRYSVLVYFMNLWTIIIFLMPLKYAEWLYLLPVMKDGWGPILADISTAFFPFLGFEIAFFLYPYLQNKEKASTGIITANTISLISYLLVTIEAFVFFSPEEIIIYHEPAIEMLKVIEFQFIERLEIVFFSFYLFIISTTVLPLMFMTVFCTSKLAGVRDKRMILATLLIMECLYVVFFPPSLPQNEFMNSIVENTGLIVACAFPLCLWAYVSIHSLVSGGRYNEGRISHLLHIVGHLTADQLQRERAGGGLGDLAYSWSGFG